MQEKITPGEGPPEFKNFQESIDYYQQFPEEITPDHLNNFHHYFPGSWIRQLVEENPERRDRVLKEVTGKNLMQYHSKKRLNQKSTEFFAEVDAVLRDLGIEFSETPSPLDPRLTKVYLELRRRGYSHYDLVQ